MQVKYRHSVFYRLYFLLKFVGIAFVSLSYDSIISSHIIAELSIILAKYLPFLQLHVEGFQIKFFPHAWHFTLILTLFCHWPELNLLPSSLHWYLHDTSLKFLIHLFL